MPKKPSKLPGRGRALVGGAVVPIKISVRGKSASGSVHIATTPSLLDAPVGKFKQTVVFMISDLPASNHPGPGESPGIGMSTVTSFSSKSKPGKANPIGTRVLIERRRQKDGIFVEEAVVVVAIVQALPQEELVSAGGDKLQLHRSPYAREQYIDLTGDTRSRIQRHWTCWHNGE